MAPPDHANIPGFLNNLGNSLDCRFSNLGELSDLNEAIDVKRQAVLLIPDGHVNKAICLNNLGRSLKRRFATQGNLEDVNEAISMQRQAISLTPGGHAEKPMRLVSLGESLSSRFEREGDLVDIDTAIQMQRQAISLTPDGHADMPHRLNSLGGSLAMRFKQSAILADINTAIEMGRRAASLIPDNHTDKPIYLLDLGVRLMDRYKSLRDVADVQEAITMFRISATSPVGNTEIKLLSARVWAEALEIAASGDELDPYRIIIDLLPQIALLWAPIRQRYQRIRKIIDDIDDDVNRAASFAIKAHKLELAVEWLEQGRSIIWSQLLNLRTPLDDLRDVDSTIAHDLEQVSLRLEIAGHGDHQEETESTLSLEQQARGHRRLAEKREELIAKARHIPGFEHFLKPRKFSELSKAACGHPVVLINVSHFRCDALVITPSNSVVLVPLTALSKATAKQIHFDQFDALKFHGVRARGQYQLPLNRNSHGLQSVLRNLWNLVVQPILSGIEDILCDTANHCFPHITWCPTGALSFLPLHAAGIYGSDKRISISDFAVSSYTPTLTALLSSHEGCSEQLTGLSKVLIISQPNTPNSSSLPGTVEEAKMIQKHISGDHLDHEHASVSAALQKMQEHRFVHLACHGIQDLDDPLKSAFVLHDGTISLKTLMKSSLDNAQLAFLSACQTATGDENLPDEAIHLASGMLAAGYPSVVGTMWSIKDADAPLVADAFYANLFGEPSDIDEQRRTVNVAYALHDATRRLRDEVGEMEFVRWVPFVHFGV